MSALCATTQSALIGPMSGGICGDFAVGLTSAIGTVGCVMGYGLLLLFSLLAYAEVTLARAVLKLRMIVGTVSIATRIALFRGVVLFCGRTVSGCGLSQGMNQLIACLSLSRQVRSESFPVKSDEENFLYEKNSAKTVLFEQYTADQPEAPIYSSMHDMDSVNTVQPLMPNDETQGAAENSDFDTGSEESIAHATLAGIARADTGRECRVECK